MAWAVDLQRDLVVLLTGFVPFGEDHYNPSGECAAYWNGKPVLTVNAGGGVKAKIIGEGYIPVKFHNSSNSRDTSTGPGAVADAIDRHKPDIVISMGQTPAHMFKVETVAHRSEAQSSVDNTGRERKAEGVQDSKLNSTLPTTAIIIAMKAVGAQVDASENAGQYVCEDVMYQILAEQGAKRDGVNIVRAGFIHLPRLVKSEDGTLLNELSRGSGDKKSHAVTQDHINKAIYAAVEATVRDVLVTDYGLVGAERQSRRGAPDPVRSVP